MCSCCRAADGGGAAGGAAGSIHGRRGGYSLLALEARGERTLFDIQNGCVLIWIGFGHKSLSLLNVNVSEDKASCTFNLPLSVKSPFAFLQFTLSLRSTRPASTSVATSASPPSQTSDGCGRARGWSGWSSSAMAASPCASKVYSLHDVFFCKDS